MYFRIVPWRTTLGLGEHLLVWSVFLFPRFLLPAGELRCDYYGTLLLALYDFTLFTRIQPRWWLSSLLLYWPWPSGHHPSPEPRVSCSGFFFFLFITHVLPFSLGRDNSLRIMPGETSWDIVLNTQPHEKERIFP